MLTLLKWLTLDKRHELNHIYLGPAMHRQQTIKPKKLWKRKSVKGPDITAKEDVNDVDEGEANNAEPDDFEDPVVVTENAEIVAIRRLKKMMLNNTWSHTEVTNLVRRGSVLVLTTPVLSTVTMM